MERFDRLTLCLAGYVGLFFASVCYAEDSSAIDESTREFFEKQVRPILVNRCYECHAGGDREPKGGLRLDSRQELLKGGDTGSAVDLQNPANSLLISAINYGDVYQMPPKSKLPATEIAVLTRWVSIGTPWPNDSGAGAGTVKVFDLPSRKAEHWCWQPVKNCTPPAVKQADWPVSSIDQFILAKLETKGLRPAAAADKRTLLRRVYFDLIGLPPTPAEVEAFVQDPDPQAFVKVVDRLLQSAHFGERWARHWLDLARYAETRGHEFEPIIPNAWQYRDYVIRALNADVSYDRFLKEQIAGDLLEPRWRDTNGPDATKPAINDALLGTGFWFLGEEVHSPVDIRKDETDRMDNRLDVLSKTFLGLTVACARCHDHKFDAISQRDYYALAGYAISGSYRQARVDTFAQHRKIAQQLDAIRREVRAESAKSLRNAIEPFVMKLDQYLIAAKQVLDDASTASSEARSAGQLSKFIEQIASEKSLDAKRLGLWTAELIAAKADKRHPLNRFIEPLILRESVSSSGSDQKSDASSSGLVVDFGSPNTNAVFQDGVSFGMKPIAVGDVVFGGTAESPQLCVATVGAWERDLFWKNIRLAPGTEVDHGTLGAWQPYGRMVRTPEFTLSTKNLWYLVRGSVRAYATVNSHLVIAGPLHGSLQREFKHDDNEWHWVSHSLDQYQHHRLHVEFSPMDDGPCTIAMVWQSQQPPKLPEIDWNGIDAGITSAATVAERAVAFRAQFADALGCLSPSANPDATNRTSPSTEQLEVRGTDPRRVRQAQLANWMVTHLSLFSSQPISIDAARKLQHEEAELAKQVQWESSLAPAMLDGNGVDEYLLVRGNSNTPKDTVHRRFLEALSSGEQTASAFDNPAAFSRMGSGRMKLAEEILRSPLAPRVAVNRIWHHLFGRGIVPSVDNLGVLGQAPSHPELLDHLADQFVSTGWSTKKMIRTLVLTRTYQMSSHPADVNAESADPNNELWHRMPIKRLEGEIIRDAILAVSGRLDRTSYGPSVPIHLTEFMQGRGRPGASGPLDGNGRRSIYIAVRRNFLSPMMLAFDTPSPFSTVGRRTVSNVPAQALILMNDPFVVEQAKLWAERLLSANPESNDQRLDQLYLTAFARLPSPHERAEAIAFLSSQETNTPDKQRDAWKNLCHVVVNLKEFVFIE